MKTKIEIIQNLLDERKITAQEAMILMEKEKEYIYLPSYQNFPVYYPPYIPYVGATSSIETTFIFSTN